MSHAFPVIGPDFDPVESLTVADREILERAVTKLALLGSQVGVDVNQMINMLECGMTVPELLAYLSDCNRRS